MDGSDSTMDENEDERHAQIWGVDPEIPIVSIFNKKSRRSIRLPHPGTNSDNDGCGIEKVLATGTRVEPSNEKKINEQFVLFSVDSPV